MVDDQQQANRVMLIGKAMSARQKMEYMRSFEFPYSDEYLKYEKIKKIGQGTFGEVWKARNRVTNEIVAMKKILTENEHQGFPITAMREIRILKHTRSENIVLLKDVVTDQAYRANKIQCIHYLIFEFCEHDLAGLLSDKNTKFRLADIKSLIKQLLLGLHYMHHNKMIHRDMKSSNVLVNKDGVLKLADFGLSRPISAKRPEALTNRVVTLWYRPPELLLGECFYTPKIDTWGAGCIMAEMWTRMPILQGNSEQMQLSFISRLCGSITVDVWPAVHKLKLFGQLQLEQGRTRKVIDTMKPYIKDSMACDLLDKLLTLDPAQRLDADAALDHDFFFCDPMPSSASSMKETFAKINGSHFEYFTSRRPNPQPNNRPGQPQHHHQQPQQQHRPPPPAHQQQQQHQHQRARHSSNMADADYLEPIF